MFRLCSLLAAFWLAAPLSAEVTGRVVVIDGDTLEVGGTRVRLHGIDSPELGQPCETESGVSWDCGAWIAGEVTDRYAGAQARCAERDVDRYGRIVARCEVGGTDIAEGLVLDGLAFAYRRYAMDYDLAEKEAAVHGAGLWSMRIEAPSAFRLGRVTADPNAPSADCIIKGNISGSGRIYHMPHNENYSRTRIEESRGERWFCTELEARAAGWRPVRN